MELLVTGAFRGAAEHIRELEEKGHHIHFMQYEKDELPCLPEKIEGVICNGLFLHHAISDFANLRYIQLTSAGFDRVPMDYIREHSIEIHNAAGVYSVPIAEFVIAGILDLYRKTDVFRENQRRHRWEKVRFLQEINGKTVCIFGCGSIGSECAKRLRAFGAHVIGIKRSAVTEDMRNRFAASGFEQIYAADTEELIALKDAAGELPAMSEEDMSQVHKRVNAAEMISRGDIIISAIPLTETTKHYFDDEKISAMKESAVFVNVSRGGVTDTEALIRALSEKRISGAILDVFEEEPLDEGSGLWDLDNVLIFPHNSFVGEGNDARLWALVRDNLENANLRA